MEKRFRPLYIGGILLFIIVIIGVAGYMIIEDFSFSEALFMVVITLSTVGFREVHPLSTPGMHFTTILIVFSFGTFTYVITTFTRFLLDGGFKYFFLTRKTEKQIKKMNDHVIVCGYGRNGRQACHELSAHNIKFVVIEKSEDVIADIQISNSEIVFINGDASRDDVLEKANINKARALITTLPIDADNVFIVMSARHLNKELVIISRASDDHSDIKLKRVGADNVIMPDKIGGIRMAKLVAQPDVVEFVENILLQSDNKVNLEEIAGEEIANCYLNKTIRDLQIRSKSGANIIGLKLSSGEYVFNPNPNTIISCKDKIFVLGTPQQVKQLIQVIHE